MKKAHLNKWRKESRRGPAHSYHQGAENGGTYLNGYEYVLNLIPISPAHGGGKG